MNNEGDLLRETARSKYFEGIHEKEMLNTKLETESKVTQVGWRIVQESSINPLGLNYYLSSTVH